MVHAMLSLSLIRFIKTRKNISQAHENLHQIIMTKLNFDSMENPPRRKTSLAIKSTLMNIIILVIIITLKVHNTSKNKFVCEGVHT
jgi:hypothetical protein